MTVAAGWAAMLTNSITARLRVPTVAARGDLAGTVAWRDHCRALRARDRGRRSCVAGGADLPGRLAPEPTSLDRADDSPDATLR